MAEKNINAHCTICGEGYHVCNDCLEQKSFKPWRTVTDTMAHYKIYMALHRYTINKDRNEANEALKNCDLADINIFLPEIKSAIEEIIGQKEKTTKRSKRNLKDVNLNVNDE